MKLEVNQKGSGGYRRDGVPNNQPLYGWIVEEQAHEIVCVGRGPDAVSGPEEVERVVLAVDTWVLASLSTSPGEVWDRKLQLELLPVWVGVLMAQLLPATAWFSAAASKWREEVTEILWRDFFGWDEVFYAPSDESAIPIRARKKGSQSRLRRTKVIGT